MYGGKIQMGHTTNKLSFSILEERPSAFPWMSNAQWVAQPEMDIKAFKLKTRVHTLTPWSLLNFKSTVLGYRAKTTKGRPMSQYRLLTALYIKRNYTYTQNYYNFPNNVQPFLF